MSNTSVDEFLASISAPQGTKRVVATLHWPVPETLESSIVGLNIADRRATLKKVYKELKEPVLKRIRKLKGSKVIDTLQGTEVAIISATPTAWHEMAKTILSSDISIRLNDPNDLFDLLSVSSASPQNTL